jgi:hypothetical protein
MKLLKYLFLASVCTAGYAQTVYELIPGSKNNLFELSLSSSTKSTIQSVNVIVQEAPEWAEFSNNELSFKNIKTSEKKTAQFYFNISEDALIGEENNITFRIIGSKGSGLTKTYNIKVVAPKTFEVLQNYPNPFNPSTTIKYSIPQDAFVSLKVFNVLGEKVSELENREMKTGLHEVVFNATNFSSGFYFYIVEAKGLDGIKYFDSKKMIVLK